MAAAMARARSGVYAHRLIVGAGRGTQIDAHCVIGPAPPPACSRRYGALIAAATLSSLRQVGPLSLASVSSPAGRLTPYRVATRIHSIAAARRCYVGGASPLARAWAPRAPSVGPTREQVTTGPSPAVVVAPGEVASSMHDGRTLFGRALVGALRCIDDGGRGHTRPPPTPPSAHPDALSGFMNRVSSGPSPRGPRVDAAASARHQCGNNEHTQQRTRVPAWGCRSASKGRRLTSVDA